MGTPFINDRHTLHPPSPAPPTFFHSCVTWFPLNDIAINDLTEQVLLPAVRKELKTCLQQTFATVFHVFFFIAMQGDIIQ